MKRKKTFSKTYAMRNEILKSIFSTECYEASDNLTSNGQMAHIDFFTGVGGFFHI